jgi:hypothetical protein
MFGKYRTWREFLDAVRAKKEKKIVGLTPGNKGVIPLRVGNENVIPLTVGNKNIIPLTVKSNQEEIDPSWEDMSDIFDEDYRLHPKNEIDPEKE